MVSHLKTFAQKGCKIAAEKKEENKSADFALLEGYFWYRCYYPHRSRDALSPVCGIFLVKTRPRPKTKLPKLVEIVPDMYPDLLFGDMS